MVLSSLSSSSSARSQGPVWCSVDSGTSASLRFMSVRRALPNQLVSSGVYCFAALVRHRPSESFPISARWLCLGGPGHLPPWGRSLSDRVGKWAIKSRVGFFPTAPVVHWSKFKALTPGNEDAISVSLRRQMLAHRSFFGGAGFSSMEAVPVHVAPTKKSKAVLRRMLSISICLAWLTTSPRRPQGKRLCSKNRGLPLPIWPATKSQMADLPH